MLNRPLSIFSLGLLLGACDSGPATLRIAAYGEPFIEDRIPAEVFVHGWEVEFDRYLVAFSEVEADGQALNGAFVVDLTQPSDGAGHELGTVTLPPGGPSNHRLSHPADRTVTVRPSLMARPSIQMDAPVSASQATSSSVADVGVDLDSEEPNVAFDLVASADSDDDGKVSVDELWETSITGQARYQVGSRDDLVDLWGFMVVQAQDLGHIDGEGHCELDVQG